MRLLTRIVATCSADSSTNTRPPEFANPTRSVPLRRRLSDQPDHRRADLLLPFHGFAHVGYVSHERIIGISKLTRLVRLFARRFTVQERLGERIADTLAELMEPHGGAVHLEAVHLCTQMRGVREEHSKTVTSVWRRGYTDNPELRREFLAEVRDRNPWT
jgi:hypothetical protein